MSFRDVEAQYRKLKAQVNAGLSEEDFKKRLMELMLQDDQGRWWTLGHETGEWYVYDDGQWVRSEPPATPPPVEPPKPEMPTEIAKPVLPAEPAEEPPPTAGDVPVEPPRAEERPHAPAVPSRTTTWPRWVSVLIIAAGWGIGLGLPWLFSPTRFSPVNLGLAGLIGGAVTALICRREEPGLRWKQALLLPAGLFIVYWLLSTTLGSFPYSRSVSGILIAALEGGIAGALIGLVLRWTVPAFRWRQVGILAVAWALAGGLGYGYNTGLGSLGSDYVLQVTYNHVVWGLILGAFGGWVTLTQLDRARLHVPAAPLPTTAGPRWVSVSVIAAGWGIGLWLPTLILPGYGYSSASVRLGLAGLIGGGVTALICRREAPALRWHQALLLPAGLFIVYWLLSATLGLAYYSLFQSRFLVPTLEGGVAGALIGLVLRWAVPAFRWRQVRILALAWALAGVFAYGSSLPVGFDSLWVAYHYYYVVWGLIMGAFGGWVTLTQLSRARLQPQQ